MFSKIFWWFKVLIIILLLPTKFTAVHNKNVTRDSPQKSVRYLSLKDKIERGMQVRENDASNWALKALKYNVTRVYTLREVYEYMQFMAECPYGHVKLQNLTIKQTRARIDAITPEGNYIPYLNISVGSYVQKPAITIVAGTHGCEWLTVAAVLNLIKQFLVFYDENFKYTNTVTWIVIPVLNPDGYDATLSNKKMRNWRKNMAKPRKSRTKEKYCFGVDLCLNFEYQWLNYDYKNASWCDTKYADTPFTQNETKALRDTVRDHLDTVKMFVSLKQQRRALMYPFRYSTTKPIFWKHYEDVTKNAAEAAYEQHKRLFKYGHVVKFENQSAGKLDDWIMIHLGVSLAFTYEIADWVNNDKTPSSREIKMVNEETLAALKAIAMKGVEFKTIDFLPSFDSGHSRKAYAVNRFGLFIAIGSFALIDV